MALPKSKLEQFKKYIEKNINCILRCINALPHFQKLMHKAAKANIPRGFRKSYLPDWSAKSEKLYKEYNTSTIALLFSITEYCSPVWERSVHCRLVDVEL